MPSGDWNQTVKEAFEAYTVLVDKIPDSDVIYIGYAICGKDNTSEAVWRIKKIDKVDNVTSIKFADTTDRFEKVWDNRTTYSY